MPAPRRPMLTRPTLPAWATRLRHLPRDARDTLFHLFIIGWTILPHLLHLPAWCSLMAAGVLAWRARLAWTSGPLPGRWLVTALLGLAAGLTLWGEHALLGKEAGVTMLVVLLTLKTLELRARRDALVVFFLGFFLVLTHFLYSQSLGIGLWMLGALWGLLTALVLAHMPVGRPPLARAGAVAARASLIALPVMLVMFVLFPRIGPLWGLPQDAAGRTGLSGSLRMGSVAELAGDDSVALRLRFLDRVPAPEQMYFRGPVLSTFDGRDWQRLVPSVPVAERPRAEIEVQGTPLRYEITVEPNRLPLLPLLEMTPDGEARRADKTDDNSNPKTGDHPAPTLPGFLLTLRPDAQWQIDRPLIERVRLQASSWPRYRHGPTAPVPGLRDLLQLPANYNPRTLQWATQLRARPELAQAGARQLSAAVLAHIGSGGYSYTLAPGTYGRDGVDEFWLDRRAGFCEHFAASYVVVMRAMGVPARIVTGYQGTDALPQDGFYLVRQNNAHAWAEIWLAGEGWLRVDPTAAVDPQRVQRGRSLRPQPGVMQDAFDRIDPELAARLRANWETLNNRWNQWVLGYSRSRQFSLLQALGVKDPSWQDLASLLIGVLCMASLAGAAWAWHDRRRQDPWQRLQRRVLLQLQRLGVPVLPHHPPRQRAQLVLQHLGARGAALAQVLNELDQQRYGARAAEVSRHKTSALPQAHWWRRFKAAARALGPVRPPATAG